MNEKSDFQKMAGEIWADIPGFEGIYRVSDRGRVFSVRGQKPMTPINNGFGYLKVNLSHGWKAKTMKVHRLVAAVFLPPCPDRHHEINHRNGIKSDNSIENLEWVTRSQNVLHAVALRAEKARTPCPS